MNDPEPSDDTSHIKEREVSPRHWHHLLLECISLLHVEREPVDQKPVGPGHLLDHLLGEDVEDDLVGDEVPSLHHTEELQSSFAAGHDLQ